LTRTRRKVMSIDLANDLWTELKNYIDRAERDDAAKVVVDLLGDYDFSADEIVAAFKSDSYVKEVIQREHPEIDLDIDELEEDDYFFNDEDEE